jgi:hypothetical protein
MTGFSAARVAGRRFVEVWWTGLLVLLFWWAFVTIGPVLDGLWTPPIRAAKLIELERLPSGATRFRVQYSKARDCRYLGTSWHVVDVEGRARRVPVRRVDRPTDLPAFSRPAGVYVGEAYELPSAPPGAKLYAVVFHSCFPTWETRSLLGPFSLE